MSSGWLLIRSPIYEFSRFQWISQTILTRIIKEIKDVNSSLTAHGAANVSIGSSGLERLKKAAAMSHISSNIPSLSSLISFLDVSTNQEYIVQRITGILVGLRKMKR